jgi:hypothetical protein
VFTVTLLPVPSNEYHEDTGSELELLSSVQESTPVATAEFTVEPSNRWEDTQSRMTGIIAYDADCQAETPGTIAMAQHIVCLAFLSKPGYRTLLATVVVVCDYA